MDNLMNRPGDTIRNLLRKTREDDAWRLDDISFLRLFLTRDNAHDAGFPRPVAPHETNAFTGIDLEIYLIQKWNIGVP